MIKTPIRILYVDDSPHDRALVRDALELEHGGFVVTEANSLDGFKRALAEGDYDVILSDFNILGFEGLQVVDIVRGFVPDLPVIIVTGTGSEEIGVEAMKRGVADYVIKSPHHIRRLSNTIDSVLESTRLRRDNERARVARYESEERLRMAIDAGGLGTWEWNLPTGEITWGGHHEEIFGLTLGSFDGEYDTFRRAVHPNDLESVEAEIARSQATRSEYRHEFRIVRPDGNIRWIAGSGRFEFDAAGNALRMLGVVQDVTERKCNELRVRDLNRIHAVLTGISEAIIRIRDPHIMLAEACRIAVERGGFRFAWVGLAEENEEMSLVAHAGLLDTYVEWLRAQLATRPMSESPAAEALRGQGHAVYNDVRCQEQMNVWRAEALRLGLGSSAAFPLIVAGKVVGAFELSSEQPNFFDEDELRLLDDLAGNVSFALEVHAKELERQRADDLLRANEDRFRRLIENASDLVTVVNADGIIRFQGPSIERILGYVPDDMIGHSAFEFVHPDDVTLVRESLANAVSAQLMPTLVEHRVRHHDGSLRTLQTVSRSVPDAEAEGYVIMNSRDVTESRRLEDQYRQSQKMEAIGQLAGGVAHDFNNVLAVILMSTDIVSDIAELPPEIADAMHDIKSAGLRGADLTRQLLLFSRRQKPLARNLDLNDAVASITKMIERIVGEDIVMSVAYEPAMLPICADPGMIDQVLMNLAVNSRDAMPGGGQLAITTESVDIDEVEAAQMARGRLGSFACLTVSDDGCGVPADTLALIFEPFFTTKDVGKGTGLGLATVFGIVQQHDGWIDVTSSPGQGTTFRVFVPRLPSDTGVSAITPRPQSSPEGTETILLVEDEPTLRSLAGGVLTRLGYRVLEAADGRSATNVWREHEGRIDLLLTDLVMPDGMSGHELAESLRAEAPGLRIVFTSGYSAEISGSRMGLREHANYLAKPFSARKLANLVRATLDG